MCRVVFSSRLQKLEVNEARVDRNEAHKGRRPTSGQSSEEHSWLISPGVLADFNLSFAAKMKNDLVRLHLFQDVLKPRVHDILSVLAGFGQFP